MTTRLLSCLLLAVFLASAVTPAAEIRRGPLVRHTQDRLEKRRPCWSPDGKTLAFARHEPDGTHIWQYLWDLEPGHLPRRLIKDREPPHFDATFSPDGSGLLLTAVRFIGLQGNLDIATIQPDGAGLKILINDDEGKVVHQEWPSWSPDGKRMAFSSTHEGNQEIYIANIDGTGITRLTQHPGQDAHPCWSADGKTIAFATDRWPGGLELATIHPDASGLTRLTQSRGLDDYPAYSRDGRHLAFVSNRDGQYEIYIARADGFEPVNLTGHPLRDTFPAWTPDGRGVTFVSNRDGGFDLYTQRLEASKP
jgi:TolB protein